MNSVEKREGEIEEELTSDEDDDYVVEPSDLPYDAWEKWGKDAIYFAALICPTKFDDPRDNGIDVYALNPCDAELPVYRVMHFSFLIQGVSPWTFAACAIIGSRVYVLACGKFWSSDINVFPDGWKRGPDPSPSLLDGTYMFSLRGKLYALNPPSSFDMSCFQLFVDDDVNGKREWVYLPPPPTLEDQKEWLDSGYEPMLLGLSCIGDSKVVLHVPTRDYIDGDRTRPVNVPRLSAEQQFLVFQLKNDSDCAGKWNTIKIRPCDSWLRYLSPDLGLPHCFPPYLSHLASSSPLIIPVLPGKLHALYDFSTDSAAPPQEVNLKWASSKSPFDFESHLNFLNNWNLIHLSGTRYCAFVIQSGLFVFTFDLVSGKDSLSAQVISTNWRYGKMTFPVFLASGKASSSSTSSS